MNKFTTKKAIHPVIATALLLVVSVVAVVGFNTWFDTYQSGMNTKVEQRSTVSMSTGIETVINNILYVKNGGSSALPIKKIKIAGTNCEYSGTVSAAFEGCLLNILSIAISVAVDFDKRPQYVHYDSAIFYVEQVIEILKNISVKDCFFNLNVPDLPVSNIKGLKITKQGKRTYKDIIIENVDPRGKKYYWIAGTPVTLSNGDDTDLFAIEKGYASLTPLHLDLTHYKYIEILKNFNNVLDK